MPWWVGTHSFVAYVSTWIGLIWLRIRTGHGSDPLRSIRCWLSPWVAEQLSARKEGLNCIKLFISSDCSDWQWIVNEKEGCGHTIPEISFSNWGQRRDISRVYCRSSSLDSNRVPQVKSQKPYHLIQLFAGTSGFRLQNGSVSFNLKMEIEPIYQTGRCHNVCFVCW
jgi:hypothetical protein